MKQGSTLQDLAAEITRQAQSKRDFIVDARALHYDHQDVLELQPGPNGKHKAKPLAFEPTELCHEQIAGKLAIPKSYYDRMRLAAPHLLATNVNHWFQNVGQRQMVRTLDGKARAFLSDRYRPLDNLDLAEAVLPTLSKVKARVVSCELTETRLYLKATLSTLTAPIKKGDVAEAGVLIANSEVGLGAVWVDPMVNILSCSNGAVMRDYGMRKHHLGRGHGGSEELFNEQAREFFKDETRAADDQAFWMKVRDVVEATFDEVLFRTIVSKWQEATEREIKRDPVEFVQEVVAKKFGLSEDEHGGVLRHLIRGGDLSQYGLANAMTRTSQEVDQYDRATELERFGGRIIELSPSDWTTLAAKTTKASKN